MRRASRPFQIFVKPAGAACNLACRYCYYVGVPGGQAGSADGPAHAAGADRMPIGLLETYIAQHLEASPAQTVAFSWHGGEPTVLGLEYFRTIVALQRKHQRPGQQVFNGVQTNGVLIDEDWCRFLAAERFGVGLSLDGPRDLHDAYRVGRGGQPSHAQALRAFRLLRQHRVSCDILCSVNAVNVGHPAGVYQFFRDLRVRYIGFLPVVRRDPGRPGGVSEHTVPADAYGRFLCTIFDHWSVSDSGRITIQMFEEAARTSSGQEPALCVFRRTCGDVPVLERTGDLYCCDHFVNEAHRVGHIAEQPLGELLDAERLRAFGRVKLEGLPRVCRVCEVRPMCHGGCPKDRFATAPDGEPGLNYLCAGFKRFFTHYLERQAAARRRGR